MSAPQISPVESYPQLHQQGLDGEVAAAAHDLRNLLNVVKCSTACMLNEGVLDAGAANRLLQATLRSVLHAEVLVRQLLERADGAPAAIDIAPEWVAPEDLLADAAAFGQPLTMQSSLSLAVAEGADLPQVWADPERLAEVFGNLLSNAVKFTPTGGCITIDASATGRQVRFTVMDTGPGLHQAGTQAVGAPRPARKPRTPLGLAICRRIVEAHGGEFRVENSTGAGAAFSFTLPARCA